MRILIFLVSILAACTFPPFAKNTPEPVAVPETNIPESPEIEIAAPRRDIRTRRAWKKPVPVTVLPGSDLINPMDGCSNVEIEDPIEGARSRLNCMKERLNIKDEE